LNVSLDVAWLSAFLLAMARTTAWLFVAPPFNSNGIPQKVRLGLGMAIALFVAPHFSGPDALADPAAFIPAVVYNLAIGLAMGFGVQLLLSAVSAAGALVDFSAGYSMAAAYDPFTNVTATPFARFYGMIATTILFATGGHRIIMKGLLTSFGSTDGGASFEQIGRILAHDFTTFFAATLQMAVPLVAALFLAEVALGLLAKAAPQMNLLSISFAVKIGGALLMGGAALKGIPVILYPLVTQAAETMVAIGRG
jgi:flagellar biosynthetic protein FliR